MSEEDVFLPYGRQVIDEEDINEVVKVLKSDCLTSGPATEKFETSLSECLNVRHAISCSSGTAALHMAVAAASLTEHDVVIVPAITFLATANAPRYLGLDVLFADVNPTTGLVDVEHVESLLKKSQGKVKLVMPVHLNGQCADMVSISALAESHNIKVISDSSHALGSEFSNENEITLAGSCVYEDMSTFSFHPVKTIAMGEGGAVTTNDDDLAKKLSLFRNHGMTRDINDFKNIEQALDSNQSANPWYYEMQEIGYNYRASDIHCALGLSQLSKLDTFIKRRSDVVSLYNTLIKPYADIIKPIKHVNHNNTAWHLFVVMIEFDDIGISRAEVMNKLRENNIGSQVHYIPLYRQPYYEKRYGSQRLKGAEEYYKKVLSLPLHFAMKDDDVHRVVETLINILEFN